jgi:hypothetical protein
MVIRARNCRNSGHHRAGIFPDSTRIGASRGSVHRLATAPMRRFHSSRLPRKPSSQAVLKTQPGHHLAALSAFRISDVQTTGICPLILGSCFYSIPRLSIPMNFRNFFTTRARIAHPPDSPLDRFENEHPESFAFPPHRMLDAIGYAKFYSR